jgi:hypothetical protein
MSCSEHDRLHVEIHRFDRRSLRVDYRSEYLGKIFGDVIPPQPNNEGIQRKENKGRRAPVSSSLRDQSSSFDVTEPGNARITGCHSGASEHSIAVESLIPIKVSRLFLTC